MLNFVARRRWLFAAAGLVFVVAAAVGWKVSALGPWLGVVVGAAVLASGLGVLAFVRLFTGVRELFKTVADLKQENVAQNTAFTADVERFRARLALAERRLAAVAIKLELTNALDEPEA